MSMYIILAFIATLVAFIAIIIFIFRREERSSLRRSGYRSNSNTSSDSGVFPFSFGAGSSDNSCGSDGGGCGGGD